MPRIAPLLALVVSLAATTAFAQQAPPATATRPATASRPAGPYAPATLPGKGLAEHNFMYAGEAAPLQLFLIKDGKVAWSYTHPKPTRGGGEISDTIALGEIEVQSSVEVTFELKPAAESSGAPAAGQTR